MFRFYPELFLRAPAFSVQAYQGADIAQLLRERYFQSAILLASPSLYRVLQKEGFVYGALSQKARLSLQKYLNRMCYRPTPFGLFAGFALISWGKQTALVLEEDKLQAHLVPAFENVLQAAGELLQKVPEDNYRYRCNGSLYQVPGEWRYLRFETDAMGKRVYYLDCVPSNKLLRAVVQYCRTAQPKASIVALISRQAAATAETSASFFDQLVDQQLLLSTWEANVTGKSYEQRLTQLAHRVLGQGYRSTYSGSLQHETFRGQANIGRQVQLLLAQGPETRTAAHLELGVEAGTLNAAHRQSICEGLACLQRLAPSLEPSGLKTFAHAFEAKFDRRTIPLLTALDPEVGVGYEELATSQEDPVLLQDLTFEQPATQDTVGTWSPAHALLLGKWTSNSSPREAICLSEKDLVALPQQKVRQLPPSLSVLFRVSQGKVYLEQAGGVSAAALLGRFTPLSKEVRMMLRRIARIEEKANPGVVFAEIAHLSDAHTANINRRTILRKYEIPILVASTLPEDRQIPLSDLWVRVEQGHIVLWSKRLGKEVVPRLSSAFNYMRDNLAVFRFLCDLQYQGLQSNFTLSLHRFFPDLEYYPRVVYMSAILHLASWHLRPERLLPLRETEGALQLERFRQLAGELGLPRHVALTRHDHQLVFDLASEADIRFLLDLIKADAPVHLQEFPFAAGDPSLAKDTAGKAYHPQFLAALYQERQVYRRRSVAPADAGKAGRTIKRKLLPGSEWLYMKIYCHPGRSNELLTAEMWPVINRLTRQGRVRQWFFVRFHDPAYHLRVRLHLAANEAGAALVALQVVLDRQVRKGVVANLQVAVYERELERYGEDLIEAVEAVFCTGSVLVADYIRQVPGGDAEESWYKVAISGAEQVLEAFGLSLPEKARLLGRMYDSLYQEFGKTKALRVQLSRKFREVCTLGHVQHQTRPAGARLALRMRHDHFLEALRHLAGQAKNKPAERQAILIADLVHLYLNRVFTDQARQQELVVYYCLWRQYKSLLAQKSTE